jgi:hypothetical protein
MILLTESQLNLLIERQGDLDFIKTSNEIFNIRNLLETRNSQYSQAEITITQLQEEL